jgi:hypothetical protein
MSRLFSTDSRKSDTTLFTGMSYTVKTTSLRTKPKYFRLLGAYIPLSASELNVVNSTNNTFVINDGSDKTITLSTNTLASVTASNASLVSDINLQLTSVAANVTVAYTGSKFVFTKGGGNDFTLDFNNANSAGPILGFPKSYSEAAAASHTAPNAVQDYNAYSFATETLLLNSSDLVEENGGVDTLDEDQLYVVGAIPAAAIDANGYFEPPSGSGDLDVSTGPLARNFDSIKQSVTTDIELYLTVASNLPINSTSTSWNAQWVLL